MAVTLTGFDELKRKLNTLPGRVANKIMRKAIKLGARPVLATMQARAPVMKHMPFKLKSGGWRMGGEARAALEIKPMKRSRGRLGVEVGIWRGQNEYTGPTWWIANVEFGHAIGKRTEAVAALSNRLRFNKHGPESYSDYRARRRASLLAVDTRSRVTPRPFIRPGWDESKAEALSVIKSVIVSMLPLEASRPA